MLDLLPIIEDRCVYNLALLYPVHTHARLFALTSVATDSQAELQFFNMPTGATGAENLLLETSYICTHTVIHARSFLLLYLHNGGFNFFQMTSHLTSF